MPLCFLSRGFHKNKVDRFGLLPLSPNVDTFIPLTYLGGQFSEFSTPLHLFVSMWFMDGSTFQKFFKTFFQQFYYLL